MRLSWVSMLSCVTLLSAGCSVKSVCTPGKSRSCAPDGGAWGWQICAPDGESYGPCTGHPALDAGVDGLVSADGPSTMDGRQPDARVDGPTGTDSDVPHADGPASADVLVPVQDGPMVTEGPLPDGPSLPAMWDSPCGLEYCTPCALCWHLIDGVCAPTLGVCAQCATHADCSAPKSVCDPYDRLCKKPGAQSCIHDLECTHDKICVKNAPPLTGGTCQPLSCGTVRACSRPVDDPGYPAYLPCKGSTVARRCDRTSSTCNTVVDVGCSATEECISVFFGNLGAVIDPMQLLWGECRARVSCVTDDDCPFDADPWMEEPLDPRIFCRNGKCVGPAKLCQRNEDCPAPFSQCYAQGFCVHPGTQCTAASQCKSLHPFAACVHATFQGKCGISL